MHIDHDAAGHRFSAKLAEGEAYLSYEPRPDGALDLRHTVVPEEARGRGTGEALVRAALEHARSSGRRVVPTCPFVRQFLEQHSELTELVAPSR